MRDVHQFLVLSPRIFNASITDVLARVERSDGTTQVARLVPQRPHFMVEAAHDGASVSRTYLVLGVQHILGGVDHLLLARVCRGAGRSGLAAARYPSSAAVFQSGSGAGAARVCLRRVGRAAADGARQTTVAPMGAGNSVDWRQQFVRTYVERDIPQLGVSIPAQTLLRFWTMVAHYHGGVWNAAEAARSMGVSEPTARRYLDLLSGLFLVRQLQPWHENLKKRQVKAPKVYVRDSGILHSLLGIGTERELLSHPNVGASWEGAAIEWALDVLQPQAAHFWATHQGAELDLLLVRGGRRYGIEVKRQDAPTLTPSMRIALADLRLEHLTVLYPGTEPYPLAPKVTVVPMASLVTRDVAALLGRSRGRRVR